MMISIIKKDIKDGIRNYKFLIIFIAFIFFAMLDPIMNKYIMPEVIKSQFPGITDEIMKEMVDMTQLGSIKAYISDVYEMVLLIIVFSLCGVISKEIKDKTLILPICSGKSFRAIVVSKLIVYGSITFCASLSASIINYLYSTVLFDNELTSIVPTLKAGLLIGIFIIFVLSVLIFIGVLTKKPIVTGLLTLAVIYSIDFIGSIFDKKEYVPIGIIQESSKLVDTFSKEVYQNMFIVISISIILIVLAIIKLSKIELGKR